MVVQKAYLRVFQMAGQTAVLWATWVQRRAAQRAALMVASTAVLRAGQMVDQKVEY
jgi:hypothetical protein